MSAEFRGDAKIQADCFGVANVQVPVGFWGKRVWMCVPWAKSSLMICRIKSFFSGWAWASVVVISDMLGRTVCRWRV